MFPKVLLKKSSVVTAALSLSLTASLFAAPLPTARAATCADVLTPMTDPLAIKMENGQTLIWDNVKPELITARDRYINLLKQKGWTITFNSAYRPYQYQRHLYEVVQNKSVCGAEMSKHGLGTLVAAPSYTAPHTAGLAFDATVRDGSGNALNSMTSVSSQLIDVAKQAGLYFPHTTTDGVHHQLSSGGSSSPVLQVGSSGPEVVTLQTNLNRVGYSLSADGVFGSGTESIVKQFQAAHGLTADGIVGSATSSKLSALASTTTVLRVGSSGDEVKVLQRLLTKKGYSVTADGAFGTGTESVVKRFQSANSLTSDGIVGSATWSKLRS
ncbi:MULTISPECIES: peptidoglycan-binding protein [Paenibacillus]|uniref:peptidoglycan-binding protein n=1 Tax=Paenibacillus TaxID=44249 RepID=UPI0022B87E05|nr:peptidoglycan-binding protein [Paenibacillus caseinilyticus]MCZ8521017.1 peptidoglycan-binding protein [Paenibacillus caseinilyticus]